MNGIIQGWLGVDKNQLADWRLAAFMFRLPYWDWAAKQTWVDNFALPQVFTMQSVKIFKEDQKWYEVSNPLWQFSNPLGPIPMGDPKMGVWAIDDNGNLPVSHVTSINSITHVFAVERVYRYKQIWYYRRDYRLDIWSQRLGAGQQCNERPATLCSMAWNFCGCCKPDVLTRLFRLLGDFCDHPTQSSWFCN